MIGKRFDDKAQLNNAEVFKIQTQIRAELNNLRKTYQDANTVSKKTFERKHYPQQLYRETLKTPERDNQFTNRSYSDCKTGKRKIEPVYLEDRKNVSPLQKRHFPARASGTINLEIKKSRHPSAYLIRRQNSITPQKAPKSILSFVDEKKASRDRPSKRIIPERHVFTKQFF